MAVKQFVVFRLATEEYAVPISEVKEIIRYNSATKLPNTSNFIEGIINLRGKILPVINLAQKFAMKTEEKIDRQALVVEMAKQEIGILVDSVTEVINLDDAAIEAVNEIMQSNKTVQSVGKIADRLLIILNLQELLTDEETFALEAVGGSRSS